jgi:hypothetical protein
MNQRGNPICLLKWLRFVLLVCNSFSSLCLFYFSQGIVSNLIFLRLSTKYTPIGVPRLGSKGLQCVCTRSQKLSSESQVTLNLKGEGGLCVPPSKLSQTGEWSDMPPAPIHFLTWKVSSIMLQPRESDQFTLPPLLPLCACSSRLDLVFWVRCPTTHWSTRDERS